MVTRYVNTASTAGGDGTTNEIVGANRAFATLAEAETQLTGQNFADNLEILCCGSTADSTQVNFDANTYVQAGYIIYINGNRDDSTGFHGGKYNAGTYKIRTIGTPLHISGTFARILIIDGIQLITHTNVSEVVFRISSAIPIGSKIKNCIIHSEINANYGIYVNSASAVLKIENCIITSKRVGNLGSDGAWVQSGDMKVYNSVINYFERGVYRSGGTATVKNCEVFDNNDDFNGTITIDHCASDDGNGTNPIVVANWADEFHNANYLTDIDFSLNNTSVLLDTGIGPDADADVPTTDILDYTRSGLTASVGPFEHEWDYTPPLEYSMLSKYNRYIVFASYINNVADLFKTIGRGIGSGIGRGIG